MSHTGVRHSLLSYKLLDQVILSYKQNYPHDDERILIGYLRSLNMYVLRWRVRECTYS